MRIGLVIVSHSALLAEGVVELATQMAPDVSIRAAGGTEDGGLGTSFDQVAAAIDDLLRDGDGVVVLSDLGSATMTAATAIELLDEGTPVVLADAPLVEGAVAAAAVAQGGANLATVVAAAETARYASTLERMVEEQDQDESLPAAPAANTSAPTPSASEARPTGAEASADPPHPEAADRSWEPGAEVSREVRIINEMGLHARPAAQIASLAVSQPAKVTINGADATSVIALLGLGVPPGGSVTVAASGARADEAVMAVVELIESGFGEEGVG